MRRDLKLELVGGHVCSWGSEEEEEEDELSCDEKVTVDFGRLTLSNGPRPITVSPGGR